MRHLVLATILLMACLASAAVAGEPRVVIEGTVAGFYIRDDSRYVHVWIVLRTGDRFVHFVCWNDTARCSRFAIGERVRAVGAYHESGCRAAYPMIKIRRLGRGD